MNGRRLALAASGLAVTLALAWWSLRAPAVDPPRVAETDAPVPAPLGSDPAMPRSGSVTPATALVSRDAGLPDAALVGAATPPTEPAAPAPAAASAEDVPLLRPPVRLARPMTVEDDLEHASMLYDYVVLRRADVRARIAEREARTERSGLAGLRRELAALDGQEDVLRRRVEELAAQVREVRGGASEPGAPE